MAILITGGAGYIATHTVIELLKQDADIIIVDNFVNSKPEALKRVREITNKSFKFYEVDITDKAALEKVFIENKIDSVIHFAGLKAVGESVKIPLKYYSNNITGTLVLCELMNQYQVKNMVFSSSATVYGMNNESPLKEEMPLSTTNPYGTTKWMIEQILTDLYSADSEWSIALLRYFNPIGAHESGKIGEDPSGIPNNLMPYITQVAAGKLSQLSIYGNDYDTHDGTGVRDYIHVVDLALGHIKALDKVLHSKGVEAYNLGTGVGYSVLDLVNTFEKTMQLKLPYTIVSRRPGDIATCYADVQKAYEEFGWKAERTLEDMCRDSWNWQSQNPNGYETCD